MQRFVQLALDLFDPRPAALFLEQKTAPAPVNTAQDTIKLVAKEPAAPSLPLSQVLPAAAFAHPQANRELRLGDAVVGIWNEAYDKTGVPAIEGTTVSGITRTLR